MAEEKRTYRDLNAQQKKTAQQIYRLWLRRYTEDQIVETLAAEYAVSLSLCHQGRVFFAASGQFVG